MRAGLLVILVLNGLVSWAKEPLIRLTCTGHKGAVAVHLSRYNLHEALPLDSANMGADKEMALGVADGQSGMYLLELDGNPHELILMAQAPTTVKAMWVDGEWRVQCPGNTEQDAFNVLLNMSAQFAAQMAQLDSVLDALPAHHARFNAITDSLTGAANQYMDGYNRSLAVIPTIFPGSYTAQVLVPLDRVPLRADNPDWLATFDNEMAFNYYHYFHYVPLGDARLLTNPFLARKVVYWLTDHCPQQETPMKLALSQLMGYCVENKPLQQRLAQMLTQLFTEGEVPVLVDHLRPYLLKP